MPEYPAQYTTGYNPVLQPSGQTGPFPAGAAVNQLATGRPTSDQPNLFAAAVKEPAVDMIRSKIAAIHGDSPDAYPVAAQPAVPRAPVSVHQQYMNQLRASGMSLADIQTAWHQYYTTLPDTEKYAVWQEFYMTNGSTTAVQPAFTQPITQSLGVPVPQALPAHQQIQTRSQERAAANRSQRQQAADRLRTAVSAENVAEVKKNILQSVLAAGKAVTGRKKQSDPTQPASQNAGGSRAKLGARQHLQSLGFGLASGAVVIVIFLFSFFNELIIAPLVQPSRKVNDTPVIVNAASTTVAGGPKVLIPKINVEIPVDYSQTTTDESQIELALDKGIVHYPTTVLPGQTGNAAYFGHSSNNIFNPGKYKFAFVLLHQLVEGDTFYLTNNGTTYAYRVFSKTIVKPSQVGVLGPVTGHTATATLITCDPPGTSINRLVVVGDQISPDPSTDAAPGAQPTATTPVVASTESQALPGNGPSLWSRIWGSVF